MPGCDFYPEGTTVLATDGELRTLHKIAGCCASGGGGGGGCQGTIYRASPSNPEAPPANVACAERLVFLDGSPIIYWIPAPVSAWSNTL